MSLVLDLLFARPKTKDQKPILECATVRLHRVGRLFLGRLTSGDQCRLCLRIGSLFAPCSPPIGHRCFERRSNGRWHFVLHASFVRFQEGITLRYSNVRTCSGSSCCCGRRSGCGVCRRRGIAVRCRSRFRVSATNEQQAGEYKEGDDYRF
jgi:hypothetical protein